MILNHVMFRRQGCDVGLILVCELCEVMSLESVSSWDKAAIMLIWIRLQEFFLGVSYSLFGCFWNSLCVETTAEAIKNGDNCCNR